MGSAAREGGRAGSVAVHTDAIRLGEVWPDAEVKAAVVRCGRPWIAAVSSSSGEQYADNRLEADHGLLERRLRPMRHLRNDRTANAVINGHALVRNLRRGPLQPHRDRAAEPAPLRRIRRTLPRHPIGPVERRRPEYITTHAAKMQHPPRRYSAEIDSARAHPFTELDQAVGRLAAVLANRPPRLIIFDDVRFDEQRRAFPTVGRWPRHSSWSSPRSTGRPRAFDRLA